MLRAALIDVGGTLWPDRWPDDARHLYVRRLSESFSLSPVQIDRLLSELETRDPALAHPLPLVQNSHAMATEALAAAGIDGVRPAELLRAMDLPAKGVIKPLDGARTFLQQLKSLGLRTIVFSNATFRTSAAYRRDFDQLNLGPLVDEVVSSVDLGYRKPSPQIFDAALRVAKCSPNECVVVGDSEEKDILPAQVLEMRTVLVAIESTPPQTSGADAVTTSLHDAAEVITEWVHTPSDRYPTRGPAGI